MNCDAVLLTGSAIVNEAMLTGKRMHSVAVAVEKKRDTCSNLTDTCFSYGNKKSPNLLQIPSFLPDILTWVYLWLGVDLWRPR